MLRLIERVKEGYASFLVTRQVELRVAFSIVSFKNQEHFYLVRSEALCAKKMLFIARLFI